MARVARTPHPMHQRRSSSFLALACIAMVLLVPHAEAVVEADAPMLRDDVLEVGHSPEAPAAGTQWQGYIRFTPDSNVTAVRYQICEVGRVCFAGPTPATDAGNGTWTFDTKDYRSGDQPIQWQAGWHVGVQWILEETTPDGVRAVPFPEGLSEDDPACTADWDACAATHYFTFTIAEGATRESPGLPVALTGLALLAVALRRRA